MNPLNLFRKPLAPWDDPRALIKWNNDEPWTIGDSFEGVQVLGDTGSGKSSTSAKVLAASMLRAGYGGLVLTVKPEDSTDWRKWLVDNGREQDGIFFGPGSDLCFNFLDYELRRGREQGSGSRNAAQILAELISLTQRSAGKADDFWNQAANEMVAAVLELILAADEVPSMRLAKEIIDSAPLSLDQAREAATAAVFVAQVTLGCDRPLAIKASGSSANSGPEYLLIQVELDGGQNQTHMIPILPGTGGRPKLGNARVLLNRLLTGITKALLPKTTPTEAERSNARLAIQQNPRLAGYNPFQSN